MTTLPWPLLMISISLQLPSFCCRMQVNLSAAISTTWPLYLDHFWWLPFCYSFPLFVVGCQFNLSAISTTWWLNLNHYKRMTTRWPPSPTLPTETMPGVVKLCVWLSTEETVVDRDWMIEPSAMIDSWQLKKMKRKLLGNFNRRIL